MTNNTNFEEIKNWVKKIYLQLEDNDYETLREELTDVHVTCVKEFVINWLDENDIKIDIE